MRRRTWLQLALFMLLPSFLMGQWLIRVPPSYLALLKGSDIAGIGKILDLSDGVLRMEVDHYWLGDQGTNVIEIQRVCLDPSPDIDSIVGSTAVFFAMTNEWKSAFYTPTSNFPADFEDSWEYSLALTNCGPVCAPRFGLVEYPSLFSAGSNDVEVVSFCSNFVESVFITRDHGLYYRTLRDALRSKSPAMLEFKAMSGLPMEAILARGSEANFVEMLYDPLLPDFFRRGALFQLKKRFGWPATNTVPEP